VKTNHLKAQGVTAASSLILVLVVTVGGILLVAGVLSWISTNNKLTQRLNRYEASVAAAGAATEKVVSRMARDFQTYDNSAVSNNLGTYRTLVPSNNDLVSSVLSPILDPITGLVISPQQKDTGSKTEWSKFEFSDAQGNAGRTYVNAVSPWAYTNLSARFPGLSGYSSTYRVVSNVRNVSSSYNSISGVKQDIVVASIPVFQYQIFYAPDLEVNPTVAMTIRDRVHCNGTIYSQPTGLVQFQGPVTASKGILRQKHPLDPSLRTGVQTFFQGGYESGVNSLNLALGTNTSLTDLHSIIEVPPAGESPTSATGRQRLYNKADLIILVSNNLGIAKSGSYNNFSVIVPWTNIAETISITGGNGKAGGNGNGKARGKKFQQGITNVYDGIISTNSRFFNARANKTNICTEIDVVTFLTKFSYLQGLLGRPVRTLYVADMRTQTPSTQSGVRIVNGDVLPSTGLTIATPNPIFLEGDYNVPLAGLGTTNTAGTVPAALIGDSITLLSEAWLEANSALPVTSRVATNATVNAALIAGIVPSGGGYYSGGLENLPRLLEDWTGKTLTINGSFVCLYNSTISTSPWGASPDVYKPPTRNWSFDPRFKTLSGLPPSTPEVRTVIRRGWQMVQANRVD
jgi:hypothetical protein